MRKAITLFMILTVGLCYAQNYNAPTYNYSGEKISLKENTFQCQQIAKLEGDKSEGYQGMDIWGNYMVSCQNSGIATIYKFSGDTINKISQFKLGCFSQYNHANVASFSNIYYSKTDVFPLLFVSQSYVNTINGKKDVIYVERISNDMRSSKLVKTIWFNDVNQLCGYAVQYVIDRESNYLYGYANTISNSDPNNRHRIIKFHVPSILDSKDSLIVLTDKDLVENYLVEDTYSAPFNPIGQGLFIKDGLLYMPVGIGTADEPSMLCVWDLHSRYMRNVIDLTKATFGELEDCSMYDGNLIIQSQGNLFRIKF